jgi:hypothetical protein
MTSNQYWGVSKERSATLVLSSKNQKEGSSSLCHVNVRVIKSILKTKFLAAI